MGRSTSTSTGKGARKGAASRSKTSTKSATTAKKGASGTRGAANTGKGSAARRDEKKTPGKKAANVRKQLASAESETKRMSSLNGGSRSDAAARRDAFRVTPRRSADASRRPRGTLMIIGGHEDKEGDKLILRELVRRLEGGKLVVATVASSVPDEIWKDYDELFQTLGVKEVVRLDVESRQDATSAEALALLDNAKGVFFTGGDQLKITSQVGDSPVFSRLHEMLEEGCIIAGTSAGASVMSETMLVSGDGRESASVRNAVDMAPGFGLIQDLVIDQHFAQRGRIGRLLAAVAQNPRILGIGIDEDTAIVVERGERFEVVGTGAVYVADASSLTYTNIVEEERHRTLSVFGVRLHVLSQGDQFDLRKRVPANFSAEVVEERLEDAEDSPQRARRSK